MIRATALLLSFLTSFALLGSAAIAKPTGDYYGAKLAAPAPEAKSVVRGMVWSCAGETCAAGEGTSRPAIVCASVARELGRVTEFRAGGEALDETALAKCNEKARDTETRVARAN